jgi:hypothetical protein
MALRQFVGSNGDQWQVWMVKPAAGYTPTIRPAERRQRSDPNVKVERRVNKTDTRMLEISPHLEHGWLCFESAAEKRRLLPVPADWANCSDGTLRRYLDQAKRVQRQVADIPYTPQQQPTAQRD